MPIFANNAWLKERGITKRDALRLERALCALVDLEGQIKTALTERGGNAHWAHAQMCEALRYMIDGE